jgi:hypothetical protein
MNRRELIRNSLLTIGAAAIDLPAGARIFSPDDNGMHELTRADWKPVFLNPHQNELLIDLSELLIPATDTPGAKAALVNRFLDLVLSVQSTETRQEFIESLSWFDDEAKERFKVSFLELTEEEKLDLLNLVAWPQTLVRWGSSESGSDGYQHFGRLKRWVADAYYTSPVGLKEQGWDGWPARGTFRGCEHQPTNFEEAK